MLPTEMRLRYKTLQKEIEARLNDFASVQKEMWCYELCYCLLTPQSKARNADSVVRLLQSLNFEKHPFNAAAILASSEHYIRFHNTKARRILAMTEQIDAVKGLLASGLHPQEERMWLTANIVGLGMKESSHFLRNIGRRGLAIIDRHIIKHLNNCGIEADAKRIGNKKYYEDVENRWLNFCKLEGITIDEMDLLFWSAETGEILK